MNDSAANVEIAKTGPQFSLRQVIAVITAVAAAIALCTVLASPPVGSIGIMEASLSGVVLALALWFSRTGLVARLGTYAVVASLLAVYFFVSSIGDWMFGHFHGPPQMTMAACIAGPIAVLTGIGWLLGTISKHLAPKSAAEKSSAGRLVVRWLGGSAIVLLTLLGGLAGWAAFAELPRAQREVASYIKQRQFRAEMRRPSAEQQRQGDRNAAATRDRPDIPGIIASRVSDLDNPDPAHRRRTASSLHAVVRSVRGSSPQAQLLVDSATKTALADHLNDEDEVVCRFVAMTIINLGDQAERPDRLKAIETLEVGTDPAGRGEAVVTLLRLIDPVDDGNGNEYRIAAIRSLGRMGSVAAPAFPRIADCLERGSPAERSAAAEALARFGPAARPFVFSFGRAWQKRLITLDDARLAYKIDPQAAAAFNIPPP